MGFSLLQLKKFEKTFDNKTVIFKEGGEGDTLYILTKGSVSVLKGIKKVAEIDQPGTFIGDMSPLLGVPRTATIVTNEVTALIVIPSSVLGTLVNDMGLKLSQVIAERLQKTTTDWVTAQNEKKDLDTNCRAEYQKLMKIIGCVYEQFKIPQIKSLYDYSRKASFLATGGYAPQIDEMHMDDNIKKAFRNFKHKV